MSEIVGGSLRFCFFATVLAQMPKLAVKTKPTLTHTELGGWKKRVLSASCERFHWKFKTCRGYLEPQNPQNHRATYTYYVDIHTYLYTIYVMYRPIDTYFAIDLGSQFPIYQITIDTLVQKRYKYIYIWGTGRYGSRL